jgi:hypothetical protein
MKVLLVASSQTIWGVFKKSPQRLREKNENAILDFD